ncbi:unnamed protein product [Heligmosomoides polygyrus]|uniref:MULE domain-containing protein n=1 Tax=Heligmosomoides polygyrus TaxID=6339 RepID=A0A183G9Q5_HELPZ|nr:unnamed protein product [Heligmosomoides polygyrus]
MVSVDVTEEQRLYLAQLDTAELYQHQAADEDTIQVDWYVEQDTASGAEEDEEGPRQNTDGYVDNSESDEDDLDESVTPHFFGVPDVSQKCQHPVLIYRVPGEDFCYSFSLHRTNRHSLVYRCIGCRRSNDTYTKIRVLRDIEFAEDPCTLAHTQDMHIYYSENIIRLAYNNGLEALVADGVFSMHPNGKEKNGQLYTIHGVCNGKVHVPMLYALTNKKTEQVYFIIWSTLKRVLDAIPQRSNNGLRAVLDFEKASIRALRRAFPGVLDTWLSGPFEDLWNKWQVATLRTTNIAENFHSHLSAATNYRRPALKRLIEILQGYTAEAEGKLLDHRQNPAAEERLRRRDIRRRRKVCEKMNNFERLMEERLVTTDDVEHYCRKMSSTIVRREQTSKLDAFGIKLNIGAILVGGGR